MQTKAARTAYASAETALPGPTRLDGSIEVPPTYQLRSVDAGCATCDCIALPAGLDPERESYGCSQPPDGGTIIIRDDIAVAQAILPSMTA